jgi:iron only hydrogenase large subunit-like protein
MPCPATAAGCPACSCSSRHCCQQYAAGTAAASGTQQQQQQQASLQQQRQVLLVMMNPCSRPALQLLFGLYRLVLMDDTIMRCPQHAATLL